MFPVPLPADPALNGQVVFDRWAAGDPLLPQGFALSPATQIIIH